MFKKSNYMKKNFIFKFTQRGSSIKIILFILYIIIVVIDNLKSQNSSRGVNHVVCIDN